MNGAELLVKILPRWRAAVASTVSPAYFDGFIERNRPQIVQMLDAWHRKRSRTAAPARASTPAPSAAPDLDEEATRAQLAVILRDYPSNLPAAATTRERKRAREYAEAVTLGNVEIPRRWTRSAVTEAIAAGIPGDAWDERGNMIGPWDEHLAAWADAWIAVAGSSKPSPSAAPEPPALLIDDEFYFREILSAGPLDRARDSEAIEWWRVQIDSPRSTLTGKRRIQAREEGIKLALEAIRTRAAAYLLGARGHDARATIFGDGLTSPLNVLGLVKDEEVLVVTDVNGKIWFAPQLDVAARQALHADIKHALGRAARILDQQRAGKRTSKESLHELASAVWGAARRDAAAVLREAATPAATAPPTQTTAAPTTAAPTTAPNDVIRLSDGAKARRAKAEAEEIARIERIAGNDAGLRDLALQLGKLADPIEKTPREIARWFSLNGQGLPARIIESYLEEGGPFGRLLEDIAEDLRETSEEHDVDDRDGRLIVSPDAILKDDHGEYVLREDREGVSRRYIVRVSPIVDKDGDQVAVQIRDTDQARSEGEPLKGGDHLLSFYFTRLTEAAIRERWRHFGMLAKALRRGPLEIERTRQLLVYAAVLVRAPKCRGDARASAKRALEVAIREHQRAAKALEVDFDEHIERIARVARYLARVAHAVAQSCAEGQTVLAVSDLTAPNNIDPELDKPTPLEEASREDDDDDVYSSIAPPGQEVG
jgi:hypothetical protein